MTESTDTILPESLVTTEWLAEHLAAPTLRIVDIRGYVKSEDLGGGVQRADYLAARDEYETGHIPGAVFVDWTEDITDPDATVKAQLAPPERFAEAMSSRGISSKTDVVVVDHTGGHFATRLWWALRAYGHDRVAVLDGGFQKWVAEMRPVTQDVPSPARAEFRPETRSDARVDADQIMAMLSRTNDASALLVDARDAGQFTGAVWRGSRKGHIPGAVNIPAKSLVNADGTWKPVEEQARLLQEGGVTADQPVIAYCNGGVTATSVLFALHRTGLHAYANYDGSWNEWGERPELPVETD